MKSKKNDLKEKEKRKNSKISISTGFLKRLVLFGLLAGVKFVEAKHRKDTHKDELRHDSKLKTICSTIGSSILMKFEYVVSNVLNMTHKKFQVDIPRSFFITHAQVHFLTNFLNSTNRLRKRA